MRSWQNTSSRTFRTNPRRTVSDQASSSCPVAVASGAWEAPACVHGVAARIHGSLRSASAAAGDSRRMLCMCEAGGALSQLQPVALYSIARSSLSMHSAWPEGVQRKLSLLPCSQLTGSGCSTTCGHALCTHACVHSATPHACRQAEGRAPEMLLSASSMLVARARSMLGRQGSSMVAWIACMAHLQPRRASPRWRLQPQWHTVRVQRDRQRRWLTQCRRAFHS
jgi:hypothetical protein